MSVVADASIRDRVDVIVIGAGWAGLAAAESLHQAGRSVCVLDKARGPGGRSSTRRQNGYSFDHGAQYFTARSKALRARLAKWRRLGLVAPWRPRLRVMGPRPLLADEDIRERWVGVPGMNAVVGALGRSLDCRYGRRVASLSYDRGWWVRLEDGDLLGSDALVLTAPPAQSAKLLGAEHPLHATLRAIDLEPTWALMIGFAGDFDAGFDAAFINGQAVSWLAGEHSKPGRAGNAWVVHASARWTRRHLQELPESIAEKLLAEFMGHVPAARQHTPELVSAHRWRYARASAPLDGPILDYDPQHLVIAGDWCAGNRIEGAWLSGQAAASRLLAKSGQ